MKIAKKIFVLVLTIALVCTMSVSSFAAVAPEATAAKAGEVVSIDFKYEDIAGIRGTFSVSNKDFIKEVDVEVKNLDAELKSGFGGTYNSDNGILAYFASKAADFVCTLKVTLADNLVPGDSCTITFEYETTADGSLPSTPNYKYDYAKIVISVNYDELDKQISAAEALKKDDYTAESWTKLEKALEDAKNANTATTQKAVDDAAKALKDAIAALEKKPAAVINYDELDKQIGAAEALKKDDYTAESWTKLQKALEDAKNAKTATTQKAVDDAAQALKAAIAALEKKPAAVTINYDELNEQIDAAQALKKDDYTAESWTKLEKALEDAKKAKTATTQKAVDDAAAALKAAIAALEKKPAAVTVKYDELNEQIDTAQALKKDDYTAESWAKLEKALENAKKAKTSTVQKDVDDAASALKAAIEALERKAVDGPSTGDDFMALPFIISALAVFGLVIFSFRKKAEEK